MAHSMYESLRAVGLQHHYDRLSSVGVRSLAHLTVLTLEDFPLLGIQTMQDRTRLFHLIQTLKTLDFPTRQQTAAGDDSEATSDNWTADHICAYANKTRDGLSSVCRRLDFTSESDHFANNAFGIDRSESIRLSGKHQTKVSTKAKQLGEDSVFKGASKPNFKTALRRKSTKEEVMQRIWTHGKNDAGCAPIYQSNTSEYNYGLHQASAPATPSKRNVHQRRSEGEPRIWVCVRKRPLTPAEQRRNEADVVSTPEKTCVLVHESKEAVDLTQYMLQHRFYFDHVFGEDCSNEEVYLQTTFPLVQHMLSGGSSTCFAYGQTGAGKTHTMLGCSPGQTGLYVLAVRDIFTHISTSPALARLSVFVSFFEIYCGQLYDLLDHRKRLFSREDGQKTVHIAGLCHVRVNSVKSLLNVIFRGTEERSQGSSGVNPLSSRSHGLLQIQLREPHQNIHGRIWFVDLAGSERASDSRHPNRQTRIEGAEINQSLLALKECIRSLDQEQSHTPFRQSKLTQVLRDSFVGDSMTCMIANISPVQSATEHTLNTLRYADRVKELKGLGPRRRRRRSKNGPSPEKTLSQCLSKSHSRGSGDNSGVLTRGKSPLKKPKRNDPLPNTPSPLRVEYDDSTFLSSTPKSSSSGKEGRVKRLVPVISPIKSPSNKAHMPQHRQESDKMTLQNQGNTDNRTNSSRNLPDQEKRRHLQLYHQQLQHLAPLTYSNQQTTSPASSSKGAVKNMISSAADMEEILGQYHACMNQKEQRFPKYEASPRLKHGNSSNMRNLKEETKVLSSKNMTKCCRNMLHEGKRIQDGVTRWAWVSENSKEMEKTCNSFGDNIGNQRKGFRTESCDSRAPAERPLSPVTHDGHSILTFSALDYSPLQVTRPKYKEEDNTYINTQFVAQDESGMIEPINLSMLTDTECFLQLKMDKEKVEDAVIPVCLDWEPEESKEESYLEMPQTIGVSMIPVALHLQSQQKAESVTIGATESLSHCAVQATSTANDVIPYTSTQDMPQHDHLNILSRMPTAACPGVSGNSCCSKKSEPRKSPGEEQCSPDQHKTGIYHIVQAHLQTRKELEVLSQKEGNLLIQQPDMDFVEYVQQLEDIMRRKAVCVRSMMAQLQPYLKAKHHSSHP